MTFGEYYPTSAQEAAPELRAEYLRLAGFEQPIVDLLADTGIDAPEFVRLVGRGCPIATAVQILL